MAITKRVIIVSMLVFLVLNIIENIIHFSIGRNIEKKYDVAFELKMPGKYDIIKITVIMIIFSILQGIFTYYGLISM